MPLNIHKLLFDLVPSGKQEKIQTPRIFPSKVVEIGDIEALKGPFRTSKGWLFGLRGRQSPLSSGQGQIQHF